MSSEVGSSKVNEFSRIQHDDFNKTPLTEHFLEIFIGSLFLLMAEGCADVTCVVTVVLIPRFMFPKKRFMLGKNLIQGGCLKK